MPRAVSCPDRDALKGVLDGAPDEGLFAHIESCSDCQTAVAHLQNSETLQDLVRSGLTLGTTIDPTAVQVLVDRVLAATVDTVAGPNPGAESFSPPLAPDELGRMGGYRVLRLLGRGGMGAVYLAEDPRLGRRVALKVLLPALAEERTMKDRFLREARAAAVLEHDNITPVYEVGEADGVPFIAMPLLKGETLAERLAREGPLPVAEVLRIGREIAAGLAAAHRAGLVHRDVKPANIWLDASAAGRVRLLDFGLARSATDDGLTQSGTVLGTPKYMAPEQARGETVDGRADLFSLGVVLYHMTTGEVPFPGDNVMAVLSALANDTPSPVRRLNPGVPAPLSTLIERLLAKSPSDRPPTAESVIADLDATPALVAAGPGRDRRKRVAVAVAAALLAAGAIAYGLHVMRYETPNGTLVVEVDDRAEVRFRQGRVEVCNAEGRVLYTLSPSEKNKTLPPGKYRVKVAGADGLALETTEFELKSNGMQAVRVTMAAPTAPVPAASLPEFPGTVVFHDTFDDPSKSLLPQVEGPPRREVRYGCFRVSQTAAKAGDLLTIGLAPRPKAGAFALRVRTLNAGVWVNFRGRITPGKDHVFDQAEVTAFGDRQLKRGRYPWDKDRWGTPTDWTIVTAPRDPALAAGQWITIAARWSDTDYEVWMNGTRLGGGAVEPPAAAVTLTGIQICSRSQVPGPMLLELDAATVWDQSGLAVGEAGPKK